MKRVLEINKNGADYELVIPKGTQGRDVEIGLAKVLIALHKRELESNKDFKMDTIFRSIEHWVRLLCEEEE